MQSHVRDMILSWRKVLDSSTAKAKGHPSFISPEKEAALLEYVAKCDQTLDDLTLKKLLNYCNDELKLKVSHSGLKKWVQKNKSLHMITATPLEHAHHEVTAAALKSNAKELRKKLDLVHPDLICNMDKTAIEGTYKTKTKTLVSTHSCP